MFLKHNFRMRGIQYNLTKAAKNTQKSKINGCERLISKEIFRIVGLLQNHLISTEL